MAVILSELAGNAANATVGGINIDATAPTTMTSVPEALPSGWYGDAVQVTLKGHDTLGGAQQTYGEPFAADLATGTHTIAYWSVDLAG